MGSGASGEKLAYTGASTDFSLEGVVVVYCKEGGGRPALSDGDLKSVEAIYEMGRRAKHEGRETD